jgi:hypothetical protein
VRAAHVNFFWRTADGAVMHARESRPTILIATVLCALACTGALGAAGTGEVAGRVDLEDGTPAVGAHVTLSPGNWSARAGPDGSFRMTAPVGHYVLTAAQGNDTAQTEVDVREGQVTVVIVEIVRAGFVTGALNPIPFVFLIAAMAAVFAGGFYVNRRMASTGIDLNKTILGGAPARKPFRRRRKAAPPPKNGQS